MASSSELSSPPPTSSPEDSRFQSSLSPKCAKRRSPYTDDEKLDLFFEHLHKELNWTFEEFLIALTSKSDYRNTRRQQSVGRATYLNTSVLQHFLNRKYTPHKTLLPRIRRALLDELDIGNYELREEVLELGKHPPFSQYQPDAELTGFEDLDLSALGELMGEYAPTTIKLLKAIAAPKRGKSHGCFEHIPRYVLILAVLCYTQRRNSSTNFQAIMGLYFHSKGVKRMPLDVLAQFGLTTSYTSIQRNIKKLSEDAIASIAITGSSQDAVTAYDNFEQVEGVQEQRLDDNQVMHSVTTGEVMRGRCIPAGGLTQDMLNPQVKLTVDDVMWANGNMVDDTEMLISRHFITEAVATVFPESIQIIFDGEDWPAMPVIDILAPTRTEHRPLGPIPHNEDSNHGNLAVLENIFLRQYHLPEKIFDRLLVLVYGDQKTVERIRTIKRRRWQSIQPYDRHAWVLPVPALFHLRMNYLAMVSRAHFGGQDPRDKSSLHHAMNFWGRKKISRDKPEFFALEELTIHSFKARIVAILWRILAKTALPSRSPEDIEDILNSQTAETFLGLVDSVRREYSLKEVREVEDQELRNHVLFLQHMQNYLLLKHAIKHADLGLLQRAISRACIYFHGSGQHKYAYEMLYMQRLIATEAASPQLQRAILANSLINRRGQPNTWFETDRLVEYHNGALKELFAARRTSSVNLDYIFRYMSLNSRTFSIIKECIDGIFGLHTNGTHPPKSARRDILVMAEDLWRGSLSFCKGRTVRNPALDLIAIGTEQLAGGWIQKFNKRECYTSVSSILEEDIAKEVGDIDSDIDIDKFFSTKDRDEYIPLDLGGF